MMLVAGMMISLFGGISVDTEAAAPGTREAAVELARSQVGYYEKNSMDCLDDYTANSGSGNYTKYARDIGVGNGQPWCAYFVWWVMQASGVDASVYPRSGWVPTMAQWFRNAGLYRNSGGSYVPNPGDIVFFGDGPGHVGIVEYVENGYVHTIEGNATDRVRQLSYNLYSSTYMVGFGIVNYKSSDTTKPVISEAKVIEQTATSYVVQCRVTDDAGVQRVTFPTWTEKDGQDDIVWADVTQSENGVYTYRVNTSEHGNEEGTYCTDIYAYDTSGNISDCYCIRVVMDRTAPGFSVMEVRNVTSEGFRLQFKADDNLSGIKHIGCMAYESGKESELPENWYEDEANFAVNTGDNRWEYEVKADDYDNETGSYDVKLLAYDNCNNVCEYTIHNIVLPEAEAVAEPSEDITETPEDVAEPSEDITETPEDVTEPTEDMTDTTENMTDTSEEMPAEAPQDEVQTGNDGEPAADVQQGDEPAADTEQADEQTADIQQADEQTADTEQETPDNISINTNLNTEVNNVENNYNTTVNEYVSNNTYVQDGMTYAAENIPVLDSVTVADTYVAEENVSITTGSAEGLTELEESNPDSVLKRALREYFESCLAALQDMGVNISAGAADDSADNEGTELVNTLNSLEVSAGEENSISYTTGIDGKTVTFRITLK